MFSFVTQYNHIKWKQSINQHGSDRFWDTSRYHPKLSDSIFQVKVIEGHGVQEGQTENFGFGCDTVFCRFCLQNAKNSVRTPFEQPK